MKTPKKDQEYQKLLKRVIALKNALYGQENWNKNHLPKTIEGCQWYIRYCRDNYDVIR